MARKGWKEITGQDGWEIVPAMRADAIQRVPNGPKMLLAALQDVANVMHKETDAADKIAVETLKLPPGILTAAVDSKRLSMIVRAGVGACHPQIDRGHDGTCGEGRLLQGDAGRQDHLCALTNIARPVWTGNSPARPSSPC